jgi:hypothetical protein
VADAETRARRREQVVNIVRQTVEPSAQWRSLRRFGQVAAIVALAASAILVFRQSSSEGDESLKKAKPMRSVQMKGSVFCRNGGPTNAWLPCRRVPLGGSGELRTLDQGSALLVTDARIHLDLRPDSKLAWSSDSSGPLSRVELIDGRLAVRVPALPAGTEFSVVTPTATVVVHGTAFIVEVLPGAEGPLGTCVRVTEGTVSVRHAAGEEPVKAPGSWGCEQPHIERVEPEPAPVAAPRVRPARSVSVAMSSGDSSPNDRSTLAVETRLLQLALSAERRGDYASAEETLLSLLSVYPRSVIAPEAREALTRIRRSTLD